MRTFKEEPEEIQIHRVTLKLPLFNSHEIDIILLGVCIKLYTINKNIEISSYYI